MAKAHYRKSTDHNVVLHKRAAGLAYVLCIQNAPTFLLSFFTAVSKHVFSLRGYLSSLSGPKCPYLSSQWVGYNFSLAHEWEDH